jgi:hypothetical protein
MRRNASLTNRPQSAGPGLIVGIVVTLTMSLALMFFMAGRIGPRSKIAASPGVQAGALTIENPTSIQAGTPTSVTVRGVRGAKRVSLLVFGSSGSLTTSTPVVNDSAQFNLNSNTTRSAGSVRLVARAGARIGSSAMTIRPGVVRDNLDPIVGPVSLVADGKDVTMSMVSPTDNLGNVADDGTLVDMYFAHPNGETETARVPVVDMVASHEFHAGTVKGNSATNARVGTQSGRSAIVRETANAPVSFTLVGPTVLPVADGFSLVRIQTSPLVDANANLLDDGAAVIFTWDGLNGRARATSRAIGGVAELVIEAPATPDTLRFEAWTLGASSEPLELTFEPATADTPLKLERKASLLIVRIGPVLGDKSELVRDGTWADVLLSGSEGGRIEQRVQLVGGSAIVREPETALRGIVELRVNVLGHDSAVRLRPEETQSSNLSGAQAASR